MLAHIRAFAKSPFATVLLSLLVVSFAFWGIKDVFGKSNFTDAVVQAGSRPPVSSLQFKDIFNQQKTAQEQRLGQPITVEDAVAHGLDHDLVDEMAAVEANSALMASEGIRPSDQLVTAEIRKITAFFDPVTGQFSKTAFETALGEHHITAAQFDGQLRDSIAERQYASGLAAGLRTPRIYGLVQAAFAKESRDFGWFALAPSTVAAPPTPTDAQLTDFIKANAAKLTKPEMRQLSVVRLSAAVLALTTPADQAEVQKRFDFQKESLSIPEKRTVVEIQVKDAKTGADIAAKLKAGGDPQAVAKAAGLQPIVLPATPKSAIPDGKIADAAFALKAGEVAGPIQGDLGIGVIKVIDVTPGHAATLADARSKIEAELKQQAAKEAVYDLVQKYENAHSGGAQMADAAKAAGQTVVALPPITANGEALAGPKPNLPPKILKAAFAQPAGAESDTIDLGQGEYWVVRVDKIIPPTLMSIDEKVPGPGGQTMSLRPILTQQYKARELTRLLQAKADAIVAEMKKGKTLDAAAAEVGAKVVQASGVLRTAGQPAQPNQPPPYPTGLVEQLFGAKIGDVVASGDYHGMAIAKLEKVGNASPPVLAGLADSIDLQTTRALYSDMGEATRLAAQRKIKPTKDYKRARQALGLDPDAAPAKPKS